MNLNRILLGLKLALLSGGRSPLSPLYDGRFTRGRVRTGTRGKLPPLTTLTGKSPYSSSAITRSSRLASVAESLEMPGRGSARGGGKTLMMARLARETDLSKRRLKAMAQFPSRQAYRAAVRRWGRSQSPRYSGISQTFASVEAMYLYR